jgi:hypothetical protein
MKRPTEDQVRAAISILVSLVIVATLTWQLLITATAIYRTHSMWVAVAFPLAPFAICTLGWLVYLAVNAYLGTKSTYRNFQYWCATGRWDRETYMMGPH